MIKKSFFATILFFLVGVSVFYGVADAYWIWTPETKKFTNPKYAVKDSPKEQFDWAMTFYSAKDYQRAATEFEKLAKQYEFSEYASKAQYYVGLCYEDMNKYYIAYQNYQKAIDNFPHIANTEEILAREFAIANLYLSKPNPKVLGADIMAPLDRAVEIFKKVVENAPYGKFAEEAQFKLGEALKKSERYEEAIQAFHKIVEDYPKSKFVTQAMYEESNCAYKASLRPAYDAAATDNAIKTFDKFVRSNKDADLAKNADTTMKRLKDNVAEKSFRAAEFYESQGKTQAAIIYYQDVIDTYPDSTFADKSKAKIEALKTKGAKKAAAPADPSKKKSKKIAQEKKPWKAFSFKSEKIQKKAETAASDTKKKKSWNLFSSKGRKAPEKAKVAASDTPKKKSWNLLNFKIGNKAKPTAKKPVEKKAWKPLSFDVAKKVEPEKAPTEPVTVEAPIVAETPVVTEKPVASETPVVQTPVVETPAVETPIAETQAVEPAVQVAAEETPKKKPWKPFSFDKKEEVKGVEPTVKEPSNKKPWNIFNLGVKKEPTAKKSVEKKVWKPLSFNAAKKETPVVQTPVVDTPAVETPIAETQAVEPAIQAAAEETPKKKPWKPFSFDKKEPKAEEASQKKRWKPLYFGTNDNTMAVTDRRW